MDSVEALALARLHAVFQVLPAAVDRAMTPTGLNSFEFAILDALDRAPARRLRLSTLAARVASALPRLSRVVSHLEKSGLVERIPCTADGRAVNAQLTDSGAAAVVRARPVDDDVAQRYLLHGMDRADVEHLADLSLRVLRNLDPEGHWEATALED